MSKKDEEPFGYAYAPDWQVDDMRLASGFYLAEWLPEELAGEIYSKEALDFIEKNKTDIHTSAEEVRSDIHDSALMIRHYVEHGFTNTSKC